MQLFVTRAAGPKAGQKLTLEVESGWSVEQLSEHIAAEHGIAPAHQHLSVNGMDMVGERTLSDYGIGREAELKLVERPPAAHADEQGTAEGALVHLHGMADGLRGRWAQVSATARALEDSKVALLQANGGAKLKKKLTLNVGGTVFKGVKRETLCAVPGSHLAELFSGRWEERLLRDSKGRIFLDVNPECFGKILTFLGDRKQRPDDPIGALSSTAALRTHPRQLYGLTDCLSSQWCLASRRNSSRRCTDCLTFSGSDTCSLSWRREYRRSMQSQSRSRTEMRLMRRRRRQQLQYSRRPSECW
jgi:hypothetical protein